MHLTHWGRIVGPLLVFAAVGTLGIVLLLKSVSERQSRAEFLALAEANADYIRDGMEAANHGAPDEKAAGRRNDLASQAQVFQKEFQSGHAAQFLDIESRLGRVAARDGGHEAVTVPIVSGAELTLTRSQPRLRDILSTSTALGALAAFWALWLALAWAVTRPSLHAQRYGLLGSMAASLAHEIRNPIAAIRLQGQLLESVSPERAGLIVYEARKMEDLLNQWMFLARPEPPRKTELPLRSLIENTVRSLAPAADHAGVNIAVSGLATRTVKADIHRLGQVFHNIILNAIQAMAEGGTLSIIVSDREIAFADSGPGFSRTALSRAASRLYSEKPGGMGLGLSVARKIVRAHEGKLILGNGPAGGALVRVVL